MTDAKEVPMCTCGDDWHANNAANHSPTCPVMAAFATLTRERDDARRDGASLADSIEDFIGAQGTAYEPDQYLMLCGVVRDYNDRLDAARTADAGTQP